MLKFEDLPVYSTFQTFQKLTTPRPQVLHKLNFYLRTKYKIQYIGFHHTIIHKNKIRNTTSRCYIPNKINPRQDKRAVAQELITSS